MYSRDDEFGSKRRFDEAFDSSALAQALKAQRRSLDHQHVQGISGINSPSGDQQQQDQTSFALRRAMALAATADSRPPESVHSAAGRGLLSLARGQNHMQGAATGLQNPFFNASAPGPSAANLDLSLLTGGANSLFAPRTTQAQNSLLLGAHRQNNNNNAGAEHQQELLAAALMQDRNQALMSRGLSSARFMNNQALFQDQLNPTTTTTDDLLRNRLAALQSGAGSNSSALESLLQGRAGAGGAMGNLGNLGSSTDHLMNSRDLSALLSGTGAGTDSNSMLLRKAAELGLGGQHHQQHRMLQQQQLMANAHLLGDGNASSLLTSSLLQGGLNGGLNDTSLLGMHNFSAPSPAALQAALRGRAGNQDHLLCRPTQSGNSPIMNSTANMANKFDENKRNNNARENLRRDFTMTVPRRQLTDEERAGIPPLPPCQEGPLAHFTQRTCVPLATDEDENWLSEFLCFIRSELVEVFRASNDDVASRINSKKVVYGQVGIRCRYCAHMAHGDRASRSSSFPSSIDRIYQSLTMMIRDHFVRCPGLPEALKARFLELKSRTTQGATDSKRYWIESARRLGMVDTQCQGIIVTEATQAAAIASIPPVRNRSGEDGRPIIMIVVNDDRPLVSEYIYFLMTQVEKVQLTESERVGNRKSMELGMPGFGCKHCCASDRKGLCRFFPARRRTLPAKIKDLADHLRRCTMCPMEVKEQLIDFKRKKLDLEPTEESNKHFFDRVWSRLHTSEKDTTTHDRDRVKKDGGN